MQENNFSSGGQEKKMLGKIGQKLPNRIIMSKISKQKRHTTKKHSVLELPKDVSQCTHF